MKTRFIPYLALIALTLFVQVSQAGSLFSGKARAEGDSLYKAAFAAYDGGDYPRAHELLNQAEKLKPDQADGWNLRGAIFLKQGLYDKAEPAFTRAVALDPNLWAAQFNHGEVAFRSKKYVLARSRFDYLVSQTNRFKEKNEWELVEYKAFLSSLLMGDETGAQKRLAKLPAAGGVTPAYAYAQAALAFQHKDTISAQKSLSLAQTTYSTTLNNLFSDSLAAAGWQAPTFVPGPALATAGPMPMAVGPAGVPSSAYSIDPKLEAAAADPLPAPEPATPTATSRLAKIIPAANTEPSDALLRPSLKATQPTASPTPIADSALERGTLLY